MNLEGATPGPYPHIAVICSHYGLLEPRSLYTLIASLPAIRTKKEKNHHVAKSGEHFHGPFRSYEG